MDESQTTIYVSDTKNNVDNPKRFTAKAQAVDCFKCLLFFLVLTLIICIVPAVTRFLIFLQPQPPQFTVAASTFSVRNASSGTADLDVTVSVHNPNARNIICDDIRAFADGEKNQSNVEVAPLEVAGKANGTIRAEFRNLAVEGNGTVNLRVEVKLEAKYEGFTWPTQRDSVRVVCEDLKAKKECEVDGRWKRLVTKCRTIFWTFIYVGGIFLAILALSL